jgi:hypothetical protein
LKYVSLIGIETLLIKFLILIQEYSNNLDNAEQHENFDFPKLHAQEHAFDGIETKGVLRNFMARLFEQLHGPFKIWYERRTNFKDVGPQVSQPHHVFVCIILKNKFG